MIEIVKKVELLAGRLEPMLLFSAGIACVLAGLFIWLGGLGFRKLLVALVGAVGGGVCGLFMTGCNIVQAVASAVVVAVITVIFEKIFTVILAAGLAAVCSFVILARPYIENSGSLRQICSQMPAQSWAIITVVVVIFMIAGFFIGRLTSALFCSVLGTILVFAGMILMLLYKGACPADFISRRPLLYAGIFAAMIVFGTLEQLLLCRPSRKELETKKTADKQEADKENRSWRNK